MRDSKNPGHIGLLITLVYVSPWLAILCAIFPPTLIVLLPIVAWLVFRVVYDCVDKKFGWTKKREIADAVPKPEDAEHIEVAKKLARWIFAGANGNPLTQLQMADEMQKQIDSFKQWSQDIATSYGKPSNCAKIEILREVIQCKQLKPADSTKIEAVREVIQYNQLRRYVLLYLYCEYYPLKMVVVFDETSISGFAFSRWIEGDDSESKESDKLAEITIKFAEWIFSGAVSHRGFAMSGEMEKLSFKQWAPMIVKNYGKPVSCTKIELVKEANKKWHVSLIYRCEQFPMKMLVVIQESYNDFKNPSIINATIEGCNEGK